MKIKAAVLGGKNNIFLKEIELPEIKEDEILVKVISNGLCFSTYKAIVQGEDHKRVPETIGTNPIITGHEFAGIIESVGEKYKDQYKKGDKFVLQPAMGLETGYSAGYSYEYFGGNATYCIIPKLAIDKGCVLIYDGNFFANASLAEPMCCIIGAYKASYHTKPYVYEHLMGIKENGNLALLGCAGPMGLGAIDYAIHGPRKPKKILVVDIDNVKLDRVKSLIPESEAEKFGIELKYINLNDEDFLEVANNFSENKKFDDVFVFAAVKSLVELGDKFLGADGCMNFFAGPQDKNFNANFNFYNVHYETTHIVGTSGGSTQDMLDSLKLSAENLINPAMMISHIGGLNSVPETKMNLHKIPGGKKIIYPHIELDLTAIEDFSRLGENNELFKKLGDICSKNNNVWSEEAETCLLKHYKVI